MRNNTRKISEITADKAAQEFDRAVRDLSSAEASDDTSAFEVAEKRRSLAAEALLSAPAMTPGDLAAKAQMVAYYCLSDDDLELPREEMAFDKLILLDLVEQLCAKAGVSYERQRPVLMSAD